MIQDPTFWFLIAFLVFFALIGKKSWQLLTSSLDGRAQKIDHEITAAIAAREKSEILLQSMQAQYQASQQQAQEIIAQAQLEAQRLKSESEAEINAFLARREQQIEERIKIIENVAIDEIKNRAIEVGIQVATAILANKIDDETDDQILARAISGLKEQNFQA